MSAEDTHVVIAPHLWRALEVMGRDMAVEPAQLVNQAVFAWLRINGYVLPGTVHEALAGAPAPTTGPAEPVQREAPTAAARPALVDLQARPTAPEAAPTTPAAAARPAPPAVEAPRPVTPPAPVAAPAPAKTDEVAAHAPAAADDDDDAVAAVVARLGEIEADLARLAKPRPAFPVEPAEDEDEEENDAADADDDEADDEAAGDDADDAEDGGDEADEPEDDDAEVPSEETAAADDEGLAATADSPESDEEPSQVEGTVVVRQVPVVLYIEREGEDTVRVEAEQFVIGRGPTCDLIIDSARVSREHVRLSRQGARFVIEDLGSSNGTWLGEERVERREVESGEEYSLGNELIRLVLRGE